MTITITEKRAIEILRAAARCRCDFECYCAGNVEWAENKLAEMRRRRKINDAMTGPDASLFDASAKKRYRAKRLG